MQETDRRPYSKRCLISHRPPFRTAEPLFYRCPECGALTIRNTPLPSLSPSSSRPAGNETIRCCGRTLSPLTPSGLSDEEHQISFTVFGGFEENALRILIGDGSHPMQEEHHIEWIYCRTFQGGQLKYLPRRGRAAAVFAFGDEDAYVYCGRSICKMGKEHCQFCCKRGNVVYAYCNVHGLFRLELDGIRGS